MIVDIGNPTHCLRDCPVCDCERMVCKADPFARPVDWTTDTIPDWCPGKEPTIRTVWDLVSQIDTYGPRFRLIGAATGKILHDSARNKKEHLEQYLDCTLSYGALHAKIDLNTDADFARPVICIWVCGK